MIKMKNTVEAVGKSNWAIFLKGSNYMKDVSGPYSQCSPTASLQKKLVIAERYWKWDQYTKDNGLLLSLLYDPSQISQNYCGELPQSKMSVMYYHSRGETRYQGVLFLKGYHLLPAWILTHNSQSQDKWKLLLICSGCLGSASAFCFSHISHH